MKYKMSKAKEILFLITIFLSSVIVMDDMILSPTINTLYEKFPNASGAVNFIVTGCYIFVVIFSIVAGNLCNRRDKKALMFIGALFGAAGGIGMIFFINPIGLAVCRGLIMIGYSFTMTVAIAIITDFYTDDERRGKVLGYYNGVMQGIGALLAFAAGLMATKSLQFAYSLHLIIILYIIMLAVFVPSMKPDAAPAQSDGGVAEKEPKEKKPGFGLRYWLLVINFSIYNFAFCIPLFYVSVYVAENGLGSEALSGTINTVITLVGFVTPLLYGKFCKAIGKNVSTTAFFLSIIGCGLLLLAPGKTLAFLGFGIIGGACPLIRTWVYDSIPGVVPETRVNDGIGYVTSISTVVSCVTAYIVTWGMTAFHYETITAFLIVPTVIFVITTAMDIVLRIISRKPAAQRITQ